jgi:hypothetical protein
MRKEQIQFIIESDIEEIVSYLIEDYGISMIDAFDKVYNSQIYAKLCDTKTGLYIQSPAYIYEYLKEELKLNDK